METSSYTVLSLYKFFEIKKVFYFKNKLLKVFKNTDVKGTVLIAPEGININISVVTNKYKYILESLKFFFDYNKNDLKKFLCRKHIYKKFKIKIKNEILTTRNLKRINPLDLVGKYIKPEDWDDFISNPNTLLIDMRNNFEVQMGTFKNAINPKCNNFTDLLKWLKEDFLKTEALKNKKIAMFCTGGIRCEKATSYLLNLGKKNVYHLQGGILKYLENNTDSKSWNGECFVFDDRVSLNNKLKQGTYFLCHACRMPLSLEDKNKKEYQEGESCHLCYYVTTNDKKQRFRMRSKQIKLKEIKLK